VTRAFDAIVIGAGQAGPSLVGKLAQAGMSVALVERERIGGTCVNTGCTPTKTMVASARALHVARRAAEFGVVIEGSIRADMAQIKARAQAVVSDSRTPLESWLSGLERCTVYRGHARFESAREVSVGAERLTSARIFLDVGARPLVPDLPGVERVPYLTNSSLLEQSELPRHLVIVGGSYVGLEFAQMFRRFGSEVTVIEKSSRIVQREDPDVSDAVRGILEHEGIAVRTSAACIALEPRGSSVCARLDCSEGAREVIGSHLLLAVGRKPNTDDLGLDKAGVQLDKRGYIVVDDSLRTTADGIWGLGDCNGKGAFTHTAYDDFAIVAGNLLEDRTRRVSERITAYALYIDPPLGRAGMTETEARKAGKRVLVGTRPMTRVSRAVEKGETQGFMKLVADAESGQILGAAILGTGGDEAIHCILDAMYARLPYRALRQAVHIHPTVAELVPTMLGELA
jgi:pyruvate/2-oxoglutarate dehydrogenase complex dihydrolipoamide dehydrogenase (E3) component